MYVRTALDEMATQGDMLEVVAKSICGIHSETWMPRNCLAKIEFNP